MCAAHKTTSKKKNPQLDCHRDWHRVKIGLENVLSLFLSASRFSVCTTLIRHIVVPICKIRSEFICENSTRKNWSITEVICSLACSTPFGSLCLFHRAMQMWAETRNRFFSLKHACVAPAREWESQKWRDKSTNWIWKHFVYDAVITFFFGHCCFLCCCLAVCSKKSQSCNVFVWHELKWIWMICTPRMK